MNPPRPPHSSSNYLETLFGLRGRVAVVTGGAQGLGFAIASALAQAGARVAVSSRSQAKAEVAAARLQKTSDQSAHGFACDVTNVESVQRLADTVLEHYEHVDILVNNAGLNIRGPIEELSPTDFERVITTNLTGPWLLCRAFAGHFKERSYGRVVNIGSIQSLVALPERSPYAASKGALLQLTRTLALEWAPFGITVNAILPGPFETEINQAQMNDPEQYRQFASRVPLGRWGKPSELAGATVYLASDAASFVTGAALTIDGGWTSQ